MPSPAPASTPPRLLPETPLPPYGYVTGHFPHPTRDPAGHMSGPTIAARRCPPPRPAPPDPARWRESHDYLSGVDLFNHGYYWEAHEVWEGLWHAVHRGGELGDFLKGLIKLAAAGVKARERRPEGTRRHARRAAELFALTKERIAKRIAEPFAGTTPAVSPIANTPAHFLLGLDVDWLHDQATKLAEDPPQLPMPAEFPPIEIVFAFRLDPR